MPKYDIQPTDDALKRFRAKLKKAGLKCRKVPAFTYTNKRTGKPVHVVAHERCYKVKRTASQVKPKKKDEPVTESQKLKDAIAANNGHPMSLTPDGKESLLYKQILDEVGGDTELADKIKAQVYSEEFKEYFGDWQNPDIESVAPVAEYDDERLNHQITYDKDFNTTMDDMEKGGDLAPDLYAHPEYYADMDSETYQSSLAVIQESRGNPEAEVTIFRGIPADGVQEIRRGEWVSLSEQYAQGEVLHHTDPSKDGIVISKIVKAKDVVWDGNDINEFAYFPDDEVESFSNIVDTNGEPLMVYHGTRAEDIVEFGETRSHGKAYWFAKTKDLAEEFGDRDDIGVYFLDSKNLFDTKADPAKIDEYSQWMEDTGISRKRVGTNKNTVDFIKAVGHPNHGDRNIYEFVRSKGYDGVVLNERNLPSNGYYEESIAVFKPRQIKSIFNDGSWNKSSGNIYGTKIGRIIAGTKWKGKTVREIISSKEGRAFLKKEGYFD